MATPHFDPKAPSVDPMFLEMDTNDVRKTKRKRRSRVHGLWRR